MSSQKDSVHEENDSEITAILEKISKNTSGFTISSLEPSEKAKLVSFLRYKARGKYLEEREKKQVDLFKRVIKEQEMAFEGLELTKRERTLMEIDREILELAGHTKALERDTYVYKMPLDYEENFKNKKVKHFELFDRYEKKEELTRKPDEELWYSKQSKNTTLKKDEGNGEEFMFDFEEELLKKKLAKQEEENLKILSTKISQPIIEQTLTEKIQAERKQLPIHGYRGQILKLIEENPITILVGETGSGKTTQLPQFLAEAGYTDKGKIVITQPRRVAAMSVATRVAFERETPLGTEVGYSVRFQNCLSNETIIKFMTDGMLLNEFISDPQLKSYNVIIIDEAHERTVSTDILFALVKDLLKDRKELKLVIASATLDAQKFAQYFENAPIINVPGRKHKVDIYYTKAPESDFVEAAVITVLQIHVTQETGDILVFLTGQEDIDRAKDEINQRLKRTQMKLRELIVLQLYSALPAEQQAKIFEPTPKGARKVILSTNIAETSLTIPNIIFVIDSGFVKQTSYDPRTNVESLAIAPISKASADQRAGRAGRVCPGKCFRLYTLLSFQTDLDEITIPEIQRSNLSEVILTLKCIGIPNIVNFDFMDAPNQQVVARAMNQLHGLGAINNEGELTRTGIRMCELPLPINYSKCIIMSEKYKCVKQIITICALMTCGQTLFFRPRESALFADKARLGFKNALGDQLSYLNAYRQWEQAGYSENFANDHFLQIRALRKARDIKEQLLSICESIGIDISDNELSRDSDNSIDLRKCLLTGFFMNTAKHISNGIYRTTKKNYHTSIHPSSYLYKKDSDQDWSPPEWVVFDELIRTSKEFMKNVVAIDSKWLVEVAPFYFTQAEIAETEGLRNLKKILDNPK